MSQIHVDGLVLGGQNSRMYCWARSYILKFTDLSSKEMKKVYYLKWSDIEQRT